MLIEKQFLQQLFLLKEDMASDIAISVSQLAVQRRDRWVARLGDLIQRRNEAIAAEKADAEARL